MITKNKTICQLKRLLFSLLLPAAITTAIPLQAQTCTSKLPRQLRIASYNIQHGVGMDHKLDYKRIANVLEDINPRDSWRASKAFRKHIAVEMAKRALIESVKRCGGEI